MNISEDLHMAIAKCESCRFYNMCKYREAIFQIQSVNIEVDKQKNEDIDILVRCKKKKKKEKQ